MGMETMDIVEGSLRDLSAIFQLAAESLDHDAFSMQLLEEKLFRNPTPTMDRYRVFLAMDGGKIIGFMQSVTRPSLSKAWLGLFATAHARRRRRVASTLLRKVIADWGACGIRQAEVLAMPGNYFSPGIDPRYTEALGFLEHHGFDRFDDCVNMTAQLEKPFETMDDERRLAGDGITIRRASETDGERLDDFFTRQFGSSWRLEVELARRNDPPALHLAIENNRIIAFGAHSSQNREWGFFGPMGTAPEARGRSIGRVLLRRCLNDLRDAGHQTAIIPWVGPIGFYARHAGCRVERSFWRYRLILDNDARDMTGQTAAGPGD